MESQGAAESTQGMGGSGMAPGHVIGGCPAERERHTLFPET